MTGDPILALVTIISGTLISLGFFYMIYRIFKLFSDRRKQGRLPDDISHEIKELREYNHYLEKRIRNLEAVVTEDDFKPEKKQSESNKTSDNTSEQTGRKKLQNTLRSDR